MSNLTFKIAGTNVNGYIKNKPSVRIASRDPLKYFSFNASNLTLEIENDPAALALLTNNAFVTVERNAEVIWSGYVDYPQGFNDPGKNKPVKIKIVPEINRLKTVKFTDGGETTVTALLNAVTTALNDAGFTGYSWDGDHISNNLQLRSFYQPAHFATGGAQPSGFVVDDEPFFSDDAIPDRLYLEDGLNAGTYYHLEDGLLKITPPIGSLTQVLKGTVNVPYLGDQDGIFSSNASFGFGKIYLVDNDENVAGSFLPFVFGIWRPMLSMSAFDYDENPVPDVFLDIAKLSDSLFTVNDKTISFTNNQSNDTQNTNLTVFEREISYRKYFDYSGLGLAMDTSSYSAPDFAVFTSLEYYYGLKFSGSVKIYDLLFVDHSTNFKIGHTLINDGTDYGRIIDVSYNTRNKEVKVKTELPEDAE